MSKTPEQSPEQENASSALTRREAVRASVLVGATVAVAGGAVLSKRLSTSVPDPTGEDTIRRLTTMDDLPVEADREVLVRMQRELVRAMAKPLEERRWVMVIDTRRCVGCHACTIACVAENQLPPGVVYRPVITEERGVFPNIAMTFTPRPCMHCDSPPCTPVCPVNATWKRPDGIVVVDYDKCIGCRYCLTACPYGARTSDFGLSYSDDVAEGAPEGEDDVLFGPRVPWAEQPSHEYGKAWVRRGHESPIGNARKCHFCLHRLEAGQLPQCTTSCIGRATFFGDFNDPTSLVSELCTRNNVQTLLPHLNTHPTVYYIV